MNNSKHRNCVKGNMRKLAIPLLCLYALLASCVGDAANPSISEQTGIPKHETSINQPIKVDPASDSYPSYTLLLDDSYIYLTLPNPRDNLPNMYCRMYFTGEIETLAEVPDFFLSMKPSVIVDDCLYIFATLTDQPTQTGMDLVNTLLRIKLDGTEFTRFPVYDGSLPGVMPYSFAGKIVAFKSRREGLELTTWIQSFDLETHEWDNVQLQGYDLSTLSGTAIYGLCSSGERLYALHDERDGVSRPSTYLKVYDSSFNETGSIELDRDVADYIASSSRLADMQAFGDYVFFDNASNMAVLGRIVEGKFQEIFRGDFFKRAPKSTPGEQLFYTSDSNTVYTLDQRTGVLTPHTLQLGGDYSIKYMMATDDLAFVYCTADEQPNYTYVLPLDQLDTAFLPCSEETLEP